MCIGIGTATLDITPEIPTALAGFAHRKGKATKIHSPILLKSFYFEKNDSVFLLLIGDLIWWDSDTVNYLKRKIHKKFDISPDCISFHATHNHSGPQTSHSFTEYLGKCDESYLNTLQEKVLEIVGKATVNTDPVDVETRIFKCDLGIHRRKMVEGKIIMAPNMDYQTDQDVCIISFIHKGTGKLKGILLHYACHPTTTDVSIINSEFTGYCCALIEKEFEGTQVGFLQGFCGDVRIAAIKEGQFYRGSLSDVEWFGEKLANQVIESLEFQPASKLKIESLNIRVSNIELRLQNDYIPNRSIDQKLIESWLEHIKECGEDRKNLHLQFFSLSKDLAFLFINAEMVMDYGKFVKEVSLKTLPIGYSNGMTGYIPTSAQIDEGGYEAEDYIYYFGQSAPFDKVIEKDIKREIIKIMGGEEYDGCFTQDKR